MAGKRVHMVGKKKSIKRGKKKKGSSGSSVKWHRPGQEHHRRFRRRGKWA